MRAHRTGSLLLVLWTTACTSFRPLPTGTSYTDRPIRVSSTGGVTVTAPHPDGDGRTLSCGGRFVQGRVESLRGDTVVMRSITGRLFDPDVPWACRSVRAGMVTARRGATVTLASKQDDAAKTLTLIGVVAVLVYAISTAELQFRTPPSTSCGAGPCF